MSSVLLVLQLIVAIFLVAVILMQRSNGGALSGLGGGDSIGGLISARGKGNILTRITAILATLFFALSMAISIYYSRLEVKKTSIVDDVVSTSLPTAQEPLPAQQSKAPTASQETPAEPQVPVAE
ncbi:MAG: preprotein translocase subunit SecG [Alphaproteobacteria bacterium]|nr:preprotein translocase subunit SecG [Alphaproteobacteria bacterium]